MKRTLNIGRQGSNNGAIEEMRPCAVCSWGPQVSTTRSFCTALSLAHSTRILFFILPYTRHTCILWLSVILSGRRLSVNAFVVIVSKFYVFCLSTFLFLCLILCDSRPPGLDDGRFKVIG